MASTPQTLSKENLNLLRNDLIKFDCGPMVYQTILEWGFRKPKGVKIIDHFNNLKIEKKCGKTDLKQWMRNNKEALEATDFSTFDVTTLHDLLPVLCYDKVLHYSTEEYTKIIKDNKSIEYLLKRIKNFRNDVSHQVTKAKEDPKIDDKKKLMEQCIRTAGALYDKDESEIDKKVSVLDAKFEMLRHETISYDNAVHYVKNKIESECSAFMLEKYSPLFTVSLPGGFGKIKSSKIFEAVNLSVAVEAKNKTKMIKKAAFEDKETPKIVKEATIEDKDDTKMVKEVTIKDKDATKMIKKAAVKIKDDSKIVISSSEICNHISNKFVVINGGPGSGKTTLMRNIFQNTLENSGNESEMSYESIDRFRVPIYLECRTERQNNLRDFLKESIPKCHASNDVIYDAFREMRGQVFLIDGYDEANDDSRKLVDEIMPFCRDNKATCIVSGRVDAGNNFISKLKKMNLAYNEMLIEPISEMSDKLSFLMRYADKMGDDVDSDELVNSFENLNDSAQEVFSCPILLALFISLFLNNRNSLSQLHNEQSAYKAIREMFYDEIVKKLTENNVNNPEVIAENLLEVFSDYSLILFGKKEYFFGKEKIRSLIKDCLNEISNNAVDIKGVFSCILTPETSFKQDKALTYSFAHSSIQEYLTVGLVIKNMKKCVFDWSSEEHSEKSLRNQFLACLGISTSLFEVKKEVERYGNIIKLLMLEILDNGDLTCYARTFTAVLREYFIQKDYFVSPDFLLDLVSSSNCDQDIVSIVSNLRRDNNGYELRYTRHFRPLTAVLKKRKPNVDIVFDCSESLTDTDCVYLCQLVSMLKEDSHIKLRLNHSHDNYQPLNEEFYKQLNNSNCVVTRFRACVTSTENLSSVMRFWRGRSYDYMHISTVSVSACDVSLAPLEGFGGELNLRIKYIDGFQSGGSNPVPEDTFLTITDIPAEGKKDVYRIIKYISPDSKYFGSIELVNCHLTDTDAYDLRKMLEGEDIRTENGEGWITTTGVEEKRVNRDKSRNLKLYLRVLKQQELEQRRAVLRKAELREAEQREAEQRENELREAEQREADQRKAEQQEAAQREAAKRAVYLRRLAVVGGMILLIKGVSFLRK